jgi:hypothetical protein
MINVRNVDDELWPGQSRPIITKKEFRLLVSAIAFCGRAFAARLCSRGLQAAAPLKLLWRSILFRSLGRWRVASLRSTGG